MPDSPPDGWIRRITRACLRHRGVTVGALLASVFGVSLEAVGPLLTRVVVDDAVQGSTAVLVPVVVAILALALVRFGASFLRRYLAGRLALTVQHDLRRQVFAAVQRLDGERQDALRTGQVVSRAITDLQLLQAVLSMTPLALGVVVLVIASVAAMLWLSPLLTLVALVMLPAAGWVTLRARASLFPATWSAQQRAADVAQQVEETVTGVRVVKGFGQESREVATLERGAARLFAERMRAARLTARLNPTLLALPTLGQVAVIGFGGTLALNGSITLGTFLAFSTYVAQLVGPARLLGSLVVSAQLARAGVERVYDLVDSQPDVVDPTSPEALPDGPLSVELDGVTFGYSRREPVLDARVAARRAGGDAGTGGHGRVGQVDRRAAAAAVLRPAGRRAAPRWRAAAGAAARRPAARARAGVRGGVPVLRHDPGQHRLRPPGRHRRRGPRGGPCGAGPSVRRVAARGLRHARRRAGAHALRWAAAADRAGPRRADRPARPRARRRHLRGRHGHRGGHPRDPPPPDGRAHHAARRAPPVDARARRPDRGARRRPRGRRGHRGRAGRAVPAVPRAAGRRGTSRPAGCADRGRSRRASDHRWHHARTVAGRGHRRRPPLSPSPRRERGVPGPVAGRTVRRRWSARSRRPPS